MTRLSTNPIHARLLLALATACGLALLATAFFAPAASAGDDNLPFDIVARVLAAPDGGSPWGTWTVEEEAGGLPYMVIAAEGFTEFPKGVPAPGARVRARGSIVGAEYKADRIELLEGSGGDDSGLPGGDDDHDGNDDGDLSGILRQRPDAPGLGVWEVECEPGVTCVVTVTAATRLVDGLPPLGAWIEADGTRAGARALVAERVRLDDAEAREIVVRLFDAADLAAFADDYHLTPITTVLPSGNIYLFSGLEDEEASLADVHGDLRVDWAELNTVYSVPAGDAYRTWKWGGEAPDGYVNQGAFDQVGLAAAHQLSTGQNVTIAILDTGARLSHPALAGRLAPGRDVVADDALPEDDGPGFGWGHGTHIAGIVARMAPDATILPVRVLDADGRGNTFTLAYAIEWAAEQGADVINLSLGAEAGSRVLSDTIAAVQAQGVIVVAAAGNDGRNTPVQYPAAFDGVIGVAAVDALNRRASFSNYGEWVDLAAPGVGITSTVPFSTGTGYASWSGTSMATGFVSGAAALLLAQGDAQPPAAGSPVGPAYTPAEVVALLAGTATPLPGSGVGGVLNTARLVGLTHATWLPQVER